MLRKCWGDDVHGKLMGILQRAPYIRCEDVHRQYAVNWLMNNGVTVQDGRDNDVPAKWVPVTERLPEDSVAVNLHTKSGVVGTGFYDKHTKSWVQYYSGGAICVDVTHWQPMPQPPKGE